MCLLVWGIQLSGEVRGVTTGGLLIRPGVGWKLNCGIGEHNSVLVLVQFKHSTFKHLNIQDWAAGN